MVVLVASKNEDPIKNEGFRVFTTLYINFCRRAGADNSGVGGGIWLKLVLVQAFMLVLVTCKNEDDRIKNEGARVFKISPIISLWGFLQMPKGS